MSYFVSKLSVGDIEITFHSGEGCCDENNQELIALLAKEYWWAWELLAQYVLERDDKFKKEVEVVKKHFPNTQARELVKGYKSICYSTYRFHHRLVKGLLEREIPFTLTTSRDG